MVFKHRTLLAVTGLSPQIVTETLYALFMQYGAEHMPNKVKILTTKDGASRAKQALLDETDGHFHKFIREYQLEGKISFEPDDIKIIRTHDGNLLDDIKTPNDNAAAADCITDLVRELTQDDESQLHVSISGGRKSMGFYLGYAFSLFARRQDILSHVLVSSPFEYHPEFYYPPKSNVVLYTAEKTPIHTNDAHIVLAEIPVVKLRRGAAIQELQKAIKYTDAVNQVEKSLNAASVEVDILNKKIICDGIQLNLKKFHLIWYIHLLICKKESMNVCLNEELFNALCRTGALIYSGIGEATDILDYFNPKKSGYDELEVPKRIRSENSKIIQKIEKLLPFAYPHYKIQTHGKKGSLSFDVSIKPENIYIHY